MAKSLLPTGNGSDADHQAFGEAARGGLTVMEAPSGHLLTEGLAAVLIRRTSRLLWLRLGPEDRDPAVFMLSVIAAAQREKPDFGTDVIELMRRRPGPINGWEPLFDRLGQEMLDHFSEGGAVVLENVHRLVADSPVLRLCTTRLFSVLKSRVTCVLITHRRIPADALPQWANYRRPWELRLPPAMVRRSLREIAPELSPQDHDRMAVLVDGRAAVLAAARAAKSTFDGGSGLPRFVRILRRRNPLAVFAEELLGTSTAEARRALGLAMRTEYAHPTLIADPHGDRLPPGPWLQTFEAGWARLRTCWRESLLSTRIGRGIRLDLAELRDAADGLLRAGGLEQAVGLYLDLGDAESAAQTISDHVDHMMDLGQWETLHGWLSRLPADVAAGHPELAYSRAEIAAVRGDNVDARHWFGIAAARFDARGDTAGTCRSMLAESVVAENAGDMAAAEERANAARAVADAAGTVVNDAGIGSLRRWSSWQRGRLALRAGDLEAALDVFAKTLDGRGLPPDLAKDATELMQRFQDLRKQRESHRLFLAALEQSERECLDRLIAELGALPQRARRLAEGTGEGWSHMPVPAKLIDLVAASAQDPTRASAFRGLVAKRRRARKKQPANVLYRPHQDLPGLPQVPQPPSRKSQASQSLRSSQLPQLPQSSESSEPPTSLRSPVLPEPPGAASAPSEPSRSRGTPYAGGQEEQNEPADSPTVDVRLSVHLLGALRVNMGGRPVEGWPAGRSRSLLAYLLVHRDPWPHREGLVEVFWPGADPKAGRNNLNVAIHGLRRVLRKVTKQPVIVHADGRYRLHPDIGLWLDVEEFERALVLGRRLEQQGRPAEAAESYERAVGLYRGDFLADVRSEDWPTLTRERLRLAHLDALDRLSDLHFRVGRHAACAELCRRIIELDPCREDAHRRLMRSYCLQGQPHLALLQYRTCREVLAVELGVPPAPSTLELYERIRRHGSP